MERAESQSQRCRPSLGSGRKGGGGGDWRDGRVVGKGRQSISADLRWQADLHRPEEVVSFLFLYHDILLHIGWPLLRLERGHDLYAAIYPHLHSVLRQMRWAGFWKHFWSKQRRQWNDLKHPF